MPTETLAPVNATPSPKSKFCQPLTEWSTAIFWLAQDTQIAIPH